MPYTFNVGDEITAARLNQSDPETHNRLLNAEYNILELYLENYFSGKQTPFQGLFFDGFSDTTKTGSIVDITIETQNKRLRISDPVGGQTLTLEYLIIAGGGGGGAPPPDQPGGGGGAGGYRTATGHIISSFSVPITVGAGGAKNTNGEDSIFDTVTSIGGGRGGVKGGTLSGASGGSGGGGALTGSGGAGTGGQGNSGGSGPGGSNSAGGGGGGAGQAGQSASGNNGGNGGNGLTSSITGMPVTRGGGGGGDKDVGGTTNGAGGSGGGAGGESNTNGTPNTGGGGGGGNGSFGQGGSGVVILRFLTADVGTSSGGIITTDGLFMIHTFNSSGTFTWTSPVPPIATGTWISIKTIFQQAKKSLKLWVVRNFSARFNLGASIAFGATTLTIAGNQTGKFANTNTIDIYDVNNFVRERKTLNAVPSFAGGFTILTFTSAIVNASGFGITAFVERVDVKPQISLVNFNAADSFQDLTFSKSLLFAATPKTLTANGNAQVDTAQSKFGGAALLLEGGTSTFVSTPDHSDWNFAGNDFTVDLWVRWASTTGNEMFIGQRQTGNWSWTFGWDGTAIVFYHTTNGTTNIPTSGAAFTPTLNTWYHLAVSRNGANLRMYIDGVQTGATFNIGSNIIFNSTLDLHIGGYAGAAGAVNGWHDEIRISNVARYTANFTPPVAAYTRDNDTVLLVHADGADASTSFTDDASGFIEVEDEYSFTNSTAEEDFKVKLLLSRQDTSLTVYAKRLGVSLTDP